MQSRRTLALWLGAAAVIAGVLLHIPDFLASRHEHQFMMAGMGMSPAMWAGMLLIVGGLVVAGWGLFGGSRAATKTANRPAGDIKFEAIDGAQLGRAHWSLLVILTIGLVIDTMKPASLGFVIPGMAHEYGMTTRDAALLPFTAITGTVIGSLAWGYLADHLGRRATLMFSSMIFMGTSICGFMPSFGWNLVMCFIMGASAGGMLPTVYSLTAESIPARQRGPLVVIQSGLGAGLGYLVASGAAALFLPIMGWRVLWLLGLPTGALLLLLCRWIPESPRYLLANGRHAEAAEVMARYGVKAVPAVATDAAAQAAVRVGPRLRGLFVPPYARRTVSIVAYGLGWGVVNWGFITFLPAFLRQAGRGDSVESMLFLSSLFALPSTVLAAYAYGRWSSRGAMLLSSCVTAAALCGFAVVGWLGLNSTVLLFMLLCLLLSSSSAMIAMLSPYSTEQYPTTLRATGSGLAAAASKMGGMTGPLLLSSAPVLGTAAGVAALPLVIAIVVVFYTGIETAGQPLPESDPVEERDDRAGLPLADAYSK